MFRRAAAAELGRWLSGLTNEVSSTEVNQEADTTGGGVIRGAERDSSGARTLVAAVDAFDVLGANGWQTDAARQNLARNDHHVGTDKTARTQGDQAVYLIAALLELVQQLLQSS